MRLKTIKKLCCPLDKQDLTLQIIAQDLNENILEGMLTCSQCQRKYPIIHGVPIMSPDEYRQTALEQQVIDRWENALSNAQTHLLNH